MKLTYNNQTIDLFSEEFFPDGPPERILLNLSGGLDSASLLYLLCKYFPSVQKHIYTGKAILTPFDAENAIDIVGWIKTKFPDNNILTHDIIEYDDFSKSVLDEVHELVKADPSYYDKYPWVDYGDPQRSMNSFLGKIAKPYVMMKVTKSLMSKYDCYKYMSAMTQNPPEDEMEKHGFLYLSETKRNPNTNQMIMFGTYTYQPYCKVDKKFVYGVFDEENLMEELFPLTGSCTGSFDSTNGFSEPCKMCFWCHEKKWAFGKY